jgi:glutathione synthase/RimK-type ligase-like ATP-grasp enzyme
MILVVTNRDDLTADWLILELERRQADFVRFNTEDYPEHVKISWQTSRATLAIGQRQIDLASVRAVWFRRPLQPHLSGDLPPRRREWAEREAREALEALWHTHDGLWVNRPERNLLASLKPEQLKRAERFGLTVPATLVTNDIESASSFLDAQPAVICKPLYSGRVPDNDETSRLFFTSLLDDEARRAIAELGPEPYLFQEHVEKRYDVRVTVIGEEVFAVRIASQETEDGRVDWRKAATATLDHSVETLPDAVATQLLALVADYGLSFAAIDLALRPDGTYVFFEVNPNGQWAWVEQLTGLPLRARLADLLLAA